MSDRLDAAVRALVDALREELEATAQPAVVEPERLLSVNDAAAALGVSRVTLYVEIQAGRCRSVKVGRRRLIPASAIADYARGEA